MVAAARVVTPSFSSRCCAVPTLEGLKQRSSERVVEPEAFGQMRGHLAMSPPNLQGQGKLAQGARDGEESPERAAPAAHEPQHDGEHLTRVAPIAPVRLTANRDLVPDMASSGR